MPTASQLYNEMQNLYKRYNTSPLISKDDLYRDMTKEMGGFQPMHDQAAAADTQAYATQAQMLADWNANGGYQPGVGPSAAQKLASMMGTQQRGYSNADAIRGQIGSLGGRVEDVASSLAQRYQAQKEDMWRQYQAKMSLYDSAANREQQARLARGSGGGGNTIIPPGWKLQKNPDGSVTLVPIGNTNTGVASNYTPSKAPTRGGILTYDNYGSGNIFGQLASSFKNSVSSNGGGIGGFFNSLGKNLKTLVSRY